MEPSIVCRACFTTISLEYIDLETPLYDTTFLDCFNYCTKLQANLDDELPNNICVSCGKSLQIAYDFIKASIEADRMFRESLLFFGNIHHFEERKDVDEIIKKFKEEDIEDLQYHTEYIEDIENINVDSIKEEQSEEMPEFEVVISNEEGAIEENNEKWSTDEDSSCGVLGLEGDENKLDNSDVVKCNICEKVIVKEEYKVHINTHLNNKTYKCDGCDEKFFSAKDIQIHKRSKHRTMRRRANFICGWCGEAFDCRSKLCQHKVIDHHGKAPSACLTCGEKFPDESGLRQHVKKAHGPEKKKVLCPYCNKEYLGIAIHIKSNHPDILNSSKLSENQCHYCFRYCQSKSILNDHLNTHTGERPYSCSFCGKTFHKKAICDRHESIVHRPDDLPKEKCDVCDFSTSNIPSLKSHMYRHRRPQGKKYLCAFCPMKFANPKKLNMHEDHNHRNVEKPFECDICKKRFAIKRKMKEHKLCVHVIGRPHECPVCKKTFKNDFQLKAHLRLHNDKQIDCSQCDKKFARHVDLKIHMRTHTGELPYECHLCDKRYAIKVRLTYHLQKHMGFKHKCSDCSSEFGSRSKLRLHMFKHIGMPYVCDLCQMGYPSRVGLRRHSKSAHKIILTDDDLLENRQRNEEKIRQNSRNTTEISSTDICNVETELEI